MNKSYEIYLDRGVLHPGHPPMIAHGVMAVSTKELNAGTILSLSNGEYSPCGSSGNPAGILLEDVAVHNASDGTITAPILKHGMVVESRLLDHSGSAEATPNATLVNKLSGVGIFPCQAGWTSSNFQ